MLSFANVELTHPDPLLLARVVACLDPADVWEWCLLGAPSRSRHLGWRASRPTRVRPGILSWPTGASRWAYAHYVASRERMEAVVAAVVAGAGSLVLDDGTRTLTVPMLLLPPRPLYDVEDSGGTFLLTLVDDRWRWWWQAIDCPISPGVTTWAELIASIGTALGVTISVDTVADAYLTPAVDLTARYDAIPPLLDAACAAAGLVLARDPEGTVRALVPASSRAREVANLALVPRMAGGSLYAG